MSDIFFQVKYNLDTGDYHLKTNLKREAYEEVLTEWIRYFCQRKGWKDGPAASGEQIVRIELDLSDDSFSTMSSPLLASDAAIVGIIKDVLDRESKLPI